MITLKKTSNEREAPRKIFFWQILFLNWIPFILYSAFVIVGALTPATKIPTLFSQLNDKVIHGAEFFLLFLFTVNLTRRIRPNHAVFAALAYCVLMGVVTECLQYNVPSRSPDFYDFLADTVGYSFSGTLWTYFARKKG